jgi:hypothetical protein
MSNSPQRANGRPGVWLAASVAALALVAGAGFAGLNYLGLSPTSAAVPAVDLNAPTALDLASSPASAALNGALAAAPAEWTRVGVQKASIAGPFPFSCAPTGTVPVLSESQDYSLAGTPAKVTLTAYTAGLGAEALNILNAGAAACKAGSDQIRQVALPGVGTEAFSLTLTRGGSEASVVSFRRGDIVGFVASTDSSASAGVAQALDQLLAPVLDSTCTTQASAPADAKRNPFAASSYDPFHVPVTVTVKDPGLPKIGSTEDYIAHDLAAPIEIPAAVTPNVLPVYPVWPDMPAGVAVPAPLVVPAVSAPTSAVLSVPAADVDGPGCGWAFTGMTAPEFDEKAGEANKKALTKAAKKSQASAVKTWSKAVTSYWKAFEPKATEVAAYRVYADQVTAANVAWNQIAAEWAGYNATYAVYQAELAAQVKFVAEQTAANDAYVAAIAACEMENGQPSSTPTPAPTSAPVPTPTPTATVKPTTSVDCYETVTQPAISNQSPPAVRPEPAKPANPRPAA